MDIRKVIQVLVIISILYQLVHPQIQNDKQMQPNFEGSFSSEDGFNREQDNSDAQHKDMLQFAEQMGNYLSDESLTFKMSTNQLEQFMLNPGADIQIVRGMFHSEMTNDDQDGAYVDLQILTNDRPYRSYREQRLGIFNINHTLKHNTYTFRFQSNDAEVQVFFSYEFVKSSKSTGQQTAKNVSEIEEIKNTFSKVNRLIVQQERQMKRLLDISEKHQEKVNIYLGRVQWSILVQTAIISMSNIICLFLLKRQIYSSYQLLV